MTHTDPALAALLRDVLDSHDDDGARLRFADRLDELGEAERAEFIRIQVELGNVENYVRVAAGQTYMLARPGEKPQFFHGPCEIDDTGRDILPMRRRADKLLVAKGPGHAMGWGYVWAGLCVSSERFEFHRGFVENLTLPADYCLAHLDAILAAHPVREVRLTTWPEVELTDAVTGERFPSFLSAGNRRTLVRLAGRPSMKSRPDAADYPVDLLRAEWPTVKDWHLPAETGENGGYLVPEELTPAMLAMLEAP